MYPTLLRIGSIRIDSYSVVWFIALSLAILWGIRRLKLYSLDEDESRRVMAISFLCMMLGARSPEYFVNWREYLAQPSLFLDLNRGSLYEFGAVAGAFVSALVMCLFSKKISFLKLCDVAIIPAFLAIAVGRWGCFLNGCCVGNVTDFCLGVHFPNDKAGILRHPTQIYYSIIAGAIVLILMFAERKILPLQRGKQRHYSVLAPLGIILYAAMRFSVALVRYPNPASLLSIHMWTYRWLLLALPFVCIWLVYSLLRLKADSSHK
ncbi:MAG: prolipoprotein diacylglyceryl transferase [Synergistaceae bacterium]|nr:prolipoprotein diacylglyceryl transferase [Synergistaceae bacterium]